MPAEPAALTGALPARPRTTGFLVVLSVYLHRWLIPASAKATPGTRLAGEH
jgi:hypothetical protein